MCWRSGYVGLCLRLVGNVCASACGLRECECTRLCVSMHIVFSRVSWCGEECMSYLLVPLPWHSPRPPAFLLKMKVISLYSPWCSVYVPATGVASLWASYRNTFPASRTCKAGGREGEGGRGGYILLACLTFPSAWRTLELWKWKKMRLIYFPVDRLGYFPFFFIFFPSLYNGWSASCQLKINSFLFLNEWCHKWRHSSFIPPFLPSPLPKKTNK